MSKPRRSLMQTENQIKAEAGRLFEWARVVRNPADRLHLLYARWALLSVLGEKHELSCLDITEAGIVGGHGAVESQIEQYEHETSPGYQGSSGRPTYIPSSSRRQMRRDKRARAAR